MRIAVNVDHLDDNAMSFFGFVVVKESADFKICRDRHNQELIVARDDSFVYVDNEFDADAMRSNLTIRIDAD